MINLKQNVFRNICISRKFINYYKQSALLAYKLKHLKEN